MKIYTKRGDKGQTDLFGGERVSKTHIRVKAYGSIDAANSAIGFAASSPDLPAELNEPLLGIMSDLFDIGAEIATAQKQSAREQLERRLDNEVDAQRVEELEHYIDSAEAKLPPLKTFVLPSGCDTAARFHLARTAVRHAEQEIVTLVESGEGVRDEVLAYINRLSDVMFVWARFCNFNARVPDLPWQAKKNR